MNNEPTEYSRSILQPAGLIKASTITPYHSKTLSTRPLRVTNRSTRATVSLRRSGHSPRPDLRHVTVGLAGPAAPPMNQCPSCSSRHLVVVVIRRQPFPPSGRSTCQAKNTVPGTAPTDTKRGFRTSPGGSTENCCVMCELTSAYRWRRPTSEVAPASARARPARATTLLVPCCAHLCLDRR